MTAAIFYSKEHVNDSCCILLHACKDMCKKQLLYYFSDALVCVCSSIANPPKMHEAIVYINVR